MTNLLDKIKSGKLTPDWLVDYLKKTNPDISSIRSSLKSEPGAFQKFWRGMMRIPKSAIRELKDFGVGVVNLIGLGAKMGWEGITGQKSLEELGEEAKEMAGAGWKGIKEYYGGYAHPLDQIQEYPLSVAVDIFSLFSLGAGVVRGAGKGMMAGLLKMKPADMALHSFIKSDPNIYSKFVRASKLIKFSKKIEPGTMINKAMKTAWNAWDKTGIAIPGIGTAKQGKMIWDTLNEKLKLSLNKAYQYAKAGPIIEAINLMPKAHQEIVSAVLQFQISPGNIKKVMPKLAEALNLSLKEYSEMKKIPTITLETFKLEPKHAKTVEKLQKLVTGTEEQLARSKILVKPEAKTRQFQPRFILEVFEKQGIPVSTSEWTEKVIGKFVPVRDLPVVIAKKKGMGMRTVRKSGMIKVLGFERGKVKFDFISETNQELGKLMSPKDLQSYIRVHPTLKEIEIMLTKPSGLMEEITKPVKAPPPKVPPKWKVKPVFEPKPEKIPTVPISSIAPAEIPVKKGIPIKVETPIYLTQLIKELEYKGAPFAKSGAKLISDYIQGSPGVVRDIGKPLIRHQVASALAIWAKDAIEWTAKYPGVKTVNEVAQELGVPTSQLLKFGLPESLAKNNRLIPIDLPLKFYKIMDDIAVGGEKMVLQEIEKGLSRAEAVGKIFGNNINSLMDNLTSIFKSTKYLSAIGVRKATNVLVVPKEIADNLLNKPVYNETMRNFVKTFIDTPINVWRATTLPFRLGWHFINIFGDFVMSILGGGRLQDFFDVIKGKYRKELENVPAIGMKAEMGATRIIPKLEEEMTPGEKFLAGKRVTEYGKKYEKILGSLQTLGVKPISEIQKMSYDLNQMVDSFGRQVAVLGTARRIAGENINRLKRFGKPLAEMKVAMESEIRDILTDPVRAERVLNKVNDFYYNYLKMTDFEKQWLRRFVFPFWSWYRHAISMVVKLAIKKPITADLLANLSRVGEDISKDISAKMGMPTEKMPEYIQAGMPIAPGMKWLTQYLPPTAITELVPGWNPFLIFFWERITGTRYFPPGKPFSSKNAVNLGGRWWKWDEQKQKAIPAESRDSLPPMLVHLLEKFPVIDFAKKMALPQARKQFLKESKRVGNVFLQGESPNTERLFTLLKWAGINIQRFDVERMVEQHDSQQKSATRYFLNRMELSPVK